MDETENIDGSGLNAEENGVIFSKDDDGIVVAKGSIFDDNCVFNLMSSGEGVMNGIVDGVLGRDVNICNGDVLFLKNEENGNGRWNGEKLEDGDHGFRVGDLVWGKVRSYPWWPGQVYDPRDASEFAVKHSQGGRLLVAFFGDGSCSWCLPSQLLPFVQNFNQMSKDVTSKSVRNAIRKAVDEVGRVLESRLTCKCIQADRRDHLVRPLVANAGVRAGVFVPELDIDQLSFPEYEPCEILTKAKDFARGVSVDDFLELRILRSILSAFYNAKCGYPLALYKEPVYIEGLEDNNEKEMAIVPITGPDNNEKEMAIVPITGPEDDQIYNGGKQRSVAELMRKRDDEQPKRKMKSVNGSSLKKKSGGQKRRLRDISEEKHKKFESDEGKDEIGNATSPRARKKSKYLSPPYTNLNWKIVGSSFKTKPESYKYIPRSPSPVFELNEESSDSDEEDQKMVIDNDKRLSFSESDINIPVKELLSGIEFAAVDPFFLRKNGSLDKVWGFVSAFRGSMFVHGEDYRVYQKSVGNENDDLISDVSLIRQKFDIMTAMLEDYCWKISSEEKCRLRNDMRSLMKYVETTSDKG